MSALSHQRLQQLGGALVRALSHERDFEYEAARAIVQDLEDLLDGDICSECEAIIPIEDGGGTVNEHHKPSCSLHGKDTFYAENPRVKGDDDGVEYGHPGDRIAGRE
jgi:hypothetical protein